MPTALVPLALAADPVPGFDAGRYVLVCACLVLLLGGIAFALRRVTRGAWRARGAKRRLEVVDVLPLGGQKRMTVVRCYDRTLVLGIGDKEVSLLAELDAEDQAPAEGLEHTELTPAPRPKRFADLLAGLGVPRPERAVRAGRREPAAATDDGGWVG